MLAEYVFKRNKACLKHLANNVDVLYVMHLNISRWSGHTIVKPSDSLLSVSVNMEGPS